MCRIKKEFQIPKDKLIQFYITDVIMSKKQMFTSLSIRKDIYGALKVAGYSDAIVNSYIVENMISDTLNLFVEKDTLTCFNNKYMPTPLNNVVACAVS